MIRLHQGTRIEQDEIRKWAYDLDPSPPVNADANVWDLMITEWFADDRLYVDLASDERCPKRFTFLALLRRRLWDRCRRTRWLATTDDQILSGLGRSVGKAKRKGRGRKEADRIVNREAKRVADEAESAALLHAEKLRDLVRHARQPEIRELGARLELFLADPGSISDEYWSPAVTA